MIVCPVFLSCPTHDYTGLYQLLRTQSVESMSSVTIPLGRKAFAIAQKTHHLSVLHDFLYVNILHKDKNLLNTYS